MKNATDLIKENLTEYPEFEYYLSTIIEEAKQNLSSQPDICIETCKSLFESVSKSIIKRLDTETSREELEKLPFDKLVKKAILLVQNDSVANDFVTRSVSLVHVLGQLRNERGDISHGRAVPKVKKSNKQLSLLSYQMTDGIISYMLDSFFRISEELREDEEADQPDIPDLEQVKYEDNKDFNELLDADMPWDDKLSYSKALYELYYEDYLIKLNDYRDFQKNPNDSE